MAKAGYSPKFFQKTNRHGMGSRVDVCTRYNCLQLLSVTFVIMPSAQAAFQFLSQLTVMLYLVMYMLMFASAIYYDILDLIQNTIYIEPLLYFFLGNTQFSGSLAFVFSFIAAEQMPTGSPTSYVLYL
ncbi:amino acid permease [Shigella flexneri]